MKTKLFAAVAVAALSLGVSAVQAAPMLNDTVTPAEATNIEPAGFKIHFGLYGYGYPYYYNYCPYTVWNGWKYVCAYY